MGTAANSEPNLRAAAKAAAHRYRSTWIELAAVLTQIKREQPYTEWKFTSFEDFVTRDLFMKPSEANQLVANYAFLEKHEKKVLEKPLEEAKIPDPKVIGLLEKADARGQLTDKQYEAIREQIWDPEVSAAEVTKEITGRFPAPPPAEPSTAQKLRRLANGGRRYYEEVKASRMISAATKERLEAAIEEIEEAAESHREARA
jgi:hypothetical protein